MAFKALFIREDVRSILQDTLQKYYSETCPFAVSVGYEPKEGSAKFLLNQYIGFIFQPYPCKEIKEYLYKSYDIRNNLLKKIAVKLLVFVLTHTERLLSNKSPLYIYPAKAVNAQTLISYLNRSIRIFDFNEGTTVSIKKVSFTSKFFDNQLQFRLSHAYDFVPKIINHSDFWFKEAILEGKSLARITDRSIFETELEKVQKYMRQAQKETLKYVTSNEYCCNLTEQLSALLLQAREQKGIATYVRTKAYLKMLTDYLPRTETKVPISETHGDLQAGNGWVGKNQTWIIDWETHAYRSVWFDSVTLIYGTRYYGGIKKLLEDCKSIESKNIVLQGFCCDLSFKEMIIVFLLEDLFFNLEDMMELPHKGGRESFDGYMNDILQNDINKFLAE